ncbi:MAG: antirestriction protein ArdA [Bacteroides sp.]|nr:antirestriction protein ArdA [Bacteroides sp.]
MEIKVFVSNLGAYNSGNLTGKWTTLPVENVESIYKEDREKYGNLPGYGDEYFISDYEVTDYEGSSVNYKINEYANLNDLNELARNLDFNDNLKSIYDRLDAEDIEKLYLPYVFDFDEYGLQELIGSNNLLEVIRKSIYGDIHSIKDDYIFLNDVNNLESISESDLYRLLDKNATELINCYKEKIL